MEKKENRKSFGSYDVIDVANEEHVTPLQDLDKGSLLLTIAYSAQVTDVVARQSDIIKRAGKDPKSIPYKWFSCDDFKALLITLKSNFNFSILLTVNKQSDEFCMYCCDSKQCCKPVVTIDIKPETGDIDVNPYVDEIRKLVDQQWYGSCCIRTVSNLQSEQ